jgi:hypothetical protein
MDRHRFKSHGERVLRARVPVKRASCRTCFHRPRLRGPVWSAAAPGVRSDVHAGTHRSDRSGVGDNACRLSVGGSLLTSNCPYPPKELRRLDGKELVPGMPVEAFISTGAHSAASCLLKPFTDQLAGAFREDEYLTTSVPCRPSWSRHYMPIPRDLPLGRATPP